MQSSSTAAFLDETFVGGTSIRQHAMYIDAIMDECPITVAHGPPTGPISPVVQRIIDISPPASAPEPYRWWYASVSYAASAICYAVKTTTLSAFADTPWTLVPHVRDIIGAAVSPEELATQSYIKLVTYMYPHTPAAHTAICAYQEERAANVVMYSILGHAASPTIPAYIVPATAARATHTAVVVPPPAVYAYILHAVSAIKKSPRALLDADRFVKPKHSDAVAWLDTFIATHTHVAGCADCTDRHIRNILAIYITVIRPANNALTVFSRIVAKMAHVKHNPATDSLSSLSSASAYAWTTLWAYIDQLAASLDTATPV